jgi:2-polyprenyl-3-methyl-5-hydroxy-6-metoxy-1,4-benzoquinol methylase
VDATLVDQRCPQGAAESLPSLLERVRCPICGSDEFCLLREATYGPGLAREDLLEIYRSSSDHTLMDQLVECAGCGLPYLNPRVRASVILESYSSAVDSRFAEQNPERIATFRRVFQKWLRRFGLEPTRVKTLLDVGCAGGAFPKVASDLGFSAIGVEPSRWLCEFGRQQYGLDLRPGTLEEQDFPPDSFDVLTMWDVVEHLFDPERTMAEAHRVLKSDGYLIINYPDYSSLPRRLLGYRWPFFLSVHLFYFNPRTMRRFLERFGFQVVEVRPYLQTLRLEYVLERAAVAFRVFALARRLAIALRLGGLPVTYYIGQTMVTARKR